MAVILIIWQTSESSVIGQQVAEKGLFGLFVTLQDNDRR
jgi:hypothetical protein